MADDSDCHPLLSTPAPLSGDTPNKRSAFAKARSYGTFLLGMSSEAPLVHTPSKGKARAAKQDDDDHDSLSATKWTTILSWFNQDLQLQNVGSVARDHLANERTFLAWLRTSLSLASIGVGGLVASLLIDQAEIGPAITQLFRLSSSTYTLPSRPSDSSSDYQLPDPATTIAQADIASVVSSLLISIQQQQAQLDALATATAHERRTYHRLGKPIGGTFIMLGLVMLATGGHRYLSVQHFLSTKNLFPPARRSVLVSSVFIAALLISSFVSILVIK